MHSHSYSLGIWVAGAVSVVALLLTAVTGLSRRCVPGSTRRWLIVSGTGIVTALALTVHFAYYYELPCPEADDTNTAVVLVPGFAPESERGELPGHGNDDLSAWLAANTNRFSLILTQEAVIWALQRTQGYIASQDATNPSLAGTLKGVPVYRIHRHVPGTNVRTLETMCFATARFSPNWPRAIILVAHDKQYERAYKDLRSVYEGQIIQPCIRNVCYSNNESLAPLWWAFRELVVATPLEALQRRWLSCHPILAFPPIRLPSDQPLPPVGSADTGI